MPTSDADLWAPVVAALGASLLTALGTFGIAAWQARRAAKSDLAAQRRGAYSRLLAVSGIIVHSAWILHLMQEVRSGISEGLDVVFRLRKPIDPLELDEWARKDVTPLYEAWSEVWTTGSSHAVTAANRVVRLAGEVLGQATTKGEGRGVAARALYGEKWTQEQLDDWWGVVQDLAKARRDLAEVARRELGVETANLFEEDGSSFSNSANAG